MNSGGADRASAPTNRGDLHVDTANATKMSSAELLAQFGAKRSDAGVSAQDVAGVLVEDLEPYQPPPEQSSWGGMGNLLSNAAQSLRAAALDATAGRKELATFVEQGGPGNSRVLANGNLEVTFSARGALGLDFDTCTWPQLRGVQPDSLSSFFPPIIKGLLLLEVDGHHVATRPMEEAYAVFAAAGRPLRMLFQYPKAVEATFEGEGFLGLNFLKEATSPLSVQHVDSDGLAATLPQVKAGLLLTAVEDELGGKQGVAGLGYDRSLLLIKVRTASLTHPPRVMARSLTSTVSWPRPTDRFPASQAAFC